MAKLDIWVLFSNLLKLKLISKYCSLCYKFVQTFCLVFPSLVFSSVPSNHHLLGLSNCLTRDGSSRDHSDLGGTDTRSRPRGSSEELQCPGWSVTQVRDYADISLSLLTSLHYVSYFNIEES